MTSTSCLSGVSEPTHLFFSVEYDDREIIKKL